MNEQAELASRTPQQGRSRASYERMLTAAERLLVKRGNDEFTLTDVSKAGKVSVGSIYLRFDTKDDLIHAVQVRVLARVREELNVILAGVIEGASGLDSFMHDFVEAYAEYLKRNAPIFRPIMLRATHDRNVSNYGKDFADRFATAAQDAMLKYRSEFGSDDHRGLVDSSYRVIYATLARYLGLGSSIEVSYEGRWDQLKLDLGRMCAAFCRAKF